MTIAPVTGTSLTETPAANSSKLPVPAAVAAAGDHQLPPTAATGKIPAVALSKTSPPSLRFFFFSDAHSRIDLTEKFVARANREKPGLVIEGGDPVHDATESEFRRAKTQRAKLQVPHRALEGNHETPLRGPFQEAPPSFPPFQSFDHQGVHFILLDNHDETLTEEQFQQIEADLKAHRQKPIIVAMHVPPFLSHESWTTKLKKVIPYELANTHMKDPAQVKRFTDLMSRYQVSAVLSGHTHKGDDAEKDGVKYVVAGAVGGNTPGWGIQHEYLDVSVQGRDVQIKRVALDKPPKEPFTFGAQVFDFYADLNEANHAQQGWNYTPSASVQLKTGLKLTQKNDQTSPALTLTPSIERELGTSGKAAIVLEPTLAGGPQELSLDLQTGLKVRPIGDYNRNLYVTGTVGANGGLIGGLSAGVGARIAAGVEVNSFTLEAGHQWATNHQATTVTLGYRF